MPTYQLLTDNDAKDDKSTLKLLRYYFKPAKLYCIFHLIKLWYGWGIHTTGFELLYFAQLDQRHSLGAAAWH